MAASRWGAAMYPIYLGSFVAVSRWGTLLHPKQMGQCDVSMLAAWQTVHDRQLWVVSKCAVPCCSC